MSGGQRHEAMTYPDEEYEYYLFARKFGWTPTQVDEQPAVLMDYLRAISIAADEVEAELNKKNV